MRRKPILVGEGSSVEAPTKEGLKNPFVDEWGEEFEDEIYSCGEVEFPSGATAESFELNNNHFSKLVEKYIGIYNSNKVKIKCKDGCIQIERIK